MKKTVLEIEYTPTNCRECILSFKRNDEWLCAGSAIKLFVDFNGDTRHDYCPLKEVEINQ